MWEDPPGLRVVASEVSAVARVRALVFRVPWSAGLADQLGLQFEVARLDLRVVASEALPAILESRALMTVVLEYRPVVRLGLPVRWVPLEVLLVVARVRVLMRVVLVGRPVVLVLQSRVPMGR